MMTRATLTYVLILAAGLASIASTFGQGAPGPAKNTAKDDVCQHVLPVEVSSVLKEKFGGWVVQSPAALSSAARERWQAEKPLGCPGIASGMFTAAKTASYAVLVVGDTKSKGEAKLLVFVGDDVSHHMTVLEQVSSGANNYFIHQAKVHQFFDAASAHKFQVVASDCIAVFDAGTDEYGVEVYFWAGDGFRHEPVDY